MKILISIGICDWKKAMQEENLQVNNSFSLLNGLNSDFAIQNKIQTILRYLLIDKDGKLINADSPRPSDPALKV